MELDLTQYTKEKLKVLPTTCEAVVIDIKQMVATDIYGESAYDPHKVYLRVFYEAAQHNLKGQDDFALMDVSELDSRSKLGQYINKYGEIAVGQKIIIMQNKVTGFYRVLLQ